VAILSPVLSATGLPFREQPWMGPTVWWRNSAPGVDLLAFVAPNPMHPWFGSLTRDWLASKPNGFNENVASIPWIALATIAGAMLWRRFRPPTGWPVFTIVFAIFALGPFVAIGSTLTYIPTPWALLRYLPLIGAARMPTRMTVLVMMGVAMMLAMAIHHLRCQSRYPRTITAAIAVLLLFELLPAPRTLHSAEVPSVYRIVGADPRPVGLLSLPFGLRDGLTAGGDFSSSTQFFQVVHGKRLVGGYISRLPRRAMARYQRHPVFSVLISLSEKQPVDPERIQAALDRAPRTLRNLSIGYVVIDTSRVSPELVDFAREAFQLRPVAVDGELELYRTPVAEPLTALKP
jgi:hypothetical protein